MRSPMSTLFPVFVLLLVATGLALAEDDAPALKIENPSDGDWYTDPSVTVEGTLAIVPLSTTLDMTVLGTVTGEGLTVTDGKLVYRVSPYFADEFSGNALNDTLWATLGSTEHLSVENGTLVIGSGGIDYMPLVHSTQDAFPSDMDVPWIAEWRLRYGTGNRFFNVAGGGITDSAYSGEGSHLGCWKEHFEVGYYVYANGNMVRGFPTETPDWNTYALHYDPGTKKYKAYLDGSFLVEFSTSQAPTRFWFGCPNYGTSTIYPSVTVDYARLWTFEASWESQVLDMGSAVLVDGASYDWSTNAQGQGTVTVQMASSDDGAVWTGWSTIDTGRAQVPVEARFLKFRADMTIPFVKDSSKRVTLDSITLDHRYPVVALEYDHDGAGWTPVEVNDTWSFDVTLSEDANHIVVRATDSKGSTNSTAVDLVLDTTRPTGTVEINGGAGITGSSEVELALLAEDRYGVTTVEVSLHPDLKQFRTFDMAGTMTYTLEGVDGPIFVYARFIDAHGLRSRVANDSIVLDTTPPEGSVSIAGGAEHSPAAAVTLTLVYGDTNGVASVEVANDEAFAEPHCPDAGVTTLDWELPSGDGMAWVYVRLTDSIGNAVVISDSIDVYVPKSEGSVTVDGDPLTNMPTVTLSIDVPEHLRAMLMQVSEDPGFDGAVWRETAGSIIWILSPGDGEKTIHVRFEDFRGFYSLPVSATVTVDATAPAVTASIPGDGFTTDRLVTLELTYDDDHAATQVWVGDSDDVGTAQRFDYQDILEWTLPDLEGERTVHVWVVDAAGNQGHAAATVVLATEGPTVTVSAPAATRADAVEVDVDVTDSLGDARVQVTIDRDPGDDDPWMDPAEASIDLAGLPEGEHAIHVRARNVAGLLSDVVTATILVDRTAPDLSILSPADGGTVSPSKLALEVRVTEGDVEYRTDGGQWTPMTGTVADLDVGKGRHTVEVRATDAAGNVATAAAGFTVEEGGESPGATLALTLLALTCAIVPTGLRRSRPPSSPRPPS